MPAKTIRSTVAGHKFIVHDVPYWVSETTGYDVMDLEVVGQVNRLIAVELARHGIVNGESFRFLRKSLGLKASAVADLLDVRKETISRWETGAATVDRASWALVAVMLLQAAGTPPDVVSLLEQARARALSPTEAANTNRDPEMSLAFAA